MLKKIKQISNKIFILYVILSMISIYFPILTSISFALDSLKTSTTNIEIINLIKEIPKYYVFDMKHFHNQECSIGDYTSQQLENYIKQIINDDSIEIRVENLEGGGNFTFMEWGADVNIIKNGTLYDTVRLGWDDGSQITTFALITIPSNIEKTVEKHIEYAQNIIENTYNWTYPYKIEKNEKLKDTDIVLLNTEKFGTVKYIGEDILSNLYTFTPEDDLEISEPLLIMQEIDNNDDDFGKGTEESPYLISTPEQLSDIRKDLSAVYKLVNDIDLTYDTSNENGKFYNNGKGWEAIGTFTGKLDGNNKKIIGMNQKFERTDDNVYETGKYGLFTNIEGTVENIALEQITIKYLDNTSDNKNSVVTTDYIGRTSRCFKWNYK